MADYNTPWAGDSVTRRAPTVAERSLGFQCGPADPDLFNFMLWYLDRWFVRAGDDASISTDPDDPQVLTKIINALIALAPGSPGAAVVTLNPIYPEVNASDGLFVLSAGTGSIAIDDGQTFIHRGATQYNTDDWDLVTERTFATVANKTYHLRWQYNGGTPIFVLKDLADGGYNPTAANENNVAFDSTYDDMLIAKVVTNGANALTVTPLKNKQNLSYSEVVTGANWQTPNANESRADFVSTPYNWSRRPKLYSFDIVLKIGAGAAADGDVIVAPLGTIYANLYTATRGYALDRYLWQNLIMIDFTSNVEIQFIAGA